MAPTKRKSGKNRPVQVDDSVGMDFVSNEAKAGFRLLNKRKIILERGINNTAPFLSYIKKNGWEVFCRTPVDANLTMATEFYANFRYRDEGGFVLCRGKLVGISPEIINDYYRLRSSQVLYKDYKQLMTDVRCEDGELVGDWTKLVREVTEKGFSMEEILPSGRWGHIDKKYLSTDMNVWYSFVASRLLPVTINSEVQWERIRMLYALKKNIAINVGSVIFHTMVVMSNSTSGFGFHSLITGLCHRAGCEDRIDDSWKSPMSMLTFEAFQRRVKQNQQAIKVVAPASESNVTIESLVVQLNAQGERLARVEDYLRRVCEHTAALLQHAKLDAFSVVEPFHVMSQEDVYGGEKRQKLDHVCDADKGPTCGDDEEMSSEHVPEENGTSSEHVEAELSRDDAAGEKGANNANEIDVAAANDGKQSDVALASNGNSDDVDINEGP